MARSVVSLLLGVLFLFGYLPTRTEPCDCTAEHNCGCRCWILASPGAATGTAPPDAAPSSSSRKKCCAPAPDPAQESPAAPAPFGHHAQHVLEFVCPEPPRADPGTVVEPVRMPSRTLRANWFAPVPHGPPRAAALQLT